MPTHRTHPLPAGHRKPNTASDAVAAKQPREVKKVVVQVAPERYSVPQPHLEPYEVSTARPHLERLFKSPALADLGIVDGARLRGEYRIWCESISDAGATQFYAAAILELALQNTKTTT